MLSAEESQPEAERKKEKPGKVKSCSNKVGSPSATDAFQPWESFIILVCACASAYSCICRFGNYFMSTTCTTSAVNKPRLIRFITCRMLLRSIYKERKHTQCFKPQSFKCMKMPLTKA